jgi:hypothetical protein
MNTRTMILRLAGISLVGVAASALAIACSADDNNGNPAPTQNDSGMGSDVTMTGDDSSMGTDTGNTVMDSGTVGMDVVIISTDGCVSEASTCNTCYTATQAAQDPYNACTAYTVNCSPFDNKSRIMGLAADGGIPSVP